MESTALPVPPIDLPDADVQTRFDALQRKLVPLWNSIQSLSQDEQTIVVVPSLTVDYPLHGSELQSYEERYLFLLLLLRQPSARLVYVTSREILPNIIDYYLALLPGVIAHHARKRLFLIAPQDGSPRPLSVKLLQRPSLIERIRSLIPDPNRAHLVPFNTTVYERDLALRLGIPMYGCDPRFLQYGTKSGCRKLFVDTGIPCPVGVEDLRTREDIVEALRKILHDKPGATSVMVKLNEGVSGDGNAVVDLGGLDGSAPTKAIDERLGAMQYEARGMTLDTYLSKMLAVGGIAEERIAGEQFRSPSAQLRVTPLGEVQLLSTHDQLLGGPSGQSFLGATFPADDGYAAAISRASIKVGERLAAEGVLGRFAIDFVAARQGSDWDIYAIELNLRKGGTTHPFLTLQFLTDGSYDAERAVFETPDGRRKCFVASDHVESDMYRAFSPEDIFDIAMRHQLHFDQTRQTGVVFHMLTALGDCGRMGMTVVGDSHADARALYDRTLRVLDEEARAALAPRALPGG